MQPIQLDLLQFHPQLRFREEKGRRYLWDAHRQKYIVVQPEELVRQLLLLYLIQAKGFAPKKIALEKTLIINNMRKRFDALIYDDDFSPRLLIECKAADVPITSSVFEQIAIYNSALRVPFLLVSNGIHTYFLRWHEPSQAFEALPEVLDYAALLD